MTHSGAGPRRGAPSSGGATPARATPIPSCTCRATLSARPVKHTCGVAAAVACRPILGGSASLLRFDARRLGFPPSTPHPLPLLSLFPVLIAIPLPSVVCSSASLARPLLDTCFPVAFIPCVAWTRCSGTLAQRRPGAALLAVTNRHAPRLLKLGWMYVCVCLGG
jgi:hypothetical protein